MIRTGLPTAGFAAAVFLLLAQPSRAQPVAAVPVAAVRVAAVRVGSHPGFGRVVVDLPAGATVDWHRDGDAVVVVMAGAGWPATPPTPPAPWHAASVSGDTLTLSLPAGDAIHPVRIGNHFVLDGVLAAKPARRKAGVAIVALPDSPEATRRDHAFMAPKPVPPLPPTVVVEQLKPAPIAAPIAAPVPVPSTSPSPMPPTETIFVKTPAGVAAAAFRRAGDGVVVFDAVLAPDLSLLPGARIVALEHAVAIVAPGLDGVHEVAGGWALGRAPAQIAAPFVAASGTDLLARLPDGEVAGRVVAMADPEGGGLLLVGTLRAGPGAPAAILATQGTPDAVFARTSRGVAVAPLSDAAVLRVTPAGWVFATEGVDRLPAGPIDPSIGTVAAAAGVARCLDLPDLPVTELRQRLRVAEQSVTDAPAGDRAHARLHVAQAMLALGLGLEADGQVGLAEADDPRVRTEPVAQLLTYAAGALTARSGATVPQAAGCPAETALFGHAAQKFAERAPDDIVLLRALSAPLRAEMLPAWADAMATADPSAAALRRLLAEDPDPVLDLARAIVEPDADRALIRLDALAAGRDPGLHVRAARLAIERRLATGRIDAHAAADAIDPLVVGWRGDRSELELRLRLAGLRAQSGAWRPALAGLREAAALASTGGFGPDDVSGDVPGDVPGDVAHTVTDRARSTFADALAADAAHAMPPLDLLALVEENATLLPADDGAVALADRLADRLAALDLTDRATKALAGLAHSAPSGPPRAALGERLGRLRLDAGDPQGALAALADSTAPAGLPDAVEARRTLLWARATAAAGDPGAALDAIDGRDDGAALDLRADLQEGQGHWAEATATRASIVAARVPAQGTLDAAQAGAVIRLAVVASRAADEATLGRLRETVSRMAPGADADQLRLLTAAPVRTVADLPRAGREATLARQVIAR